MRLPRDGILQFRAKRIFYCIIPRQCALQVVGLRAGHAAEVAEKQGLTIRRAVQVGRLAAHREMNLLRWAVRKLAGSLGWATGALGARGHPYKAGVLQAGDQFVKDQTLAWCSVV